MISSFWWLWALRQISSAWGSTHTGFYWVAGLETHTSPAHIIGFQNSPQLSRFFQWSGYRSLCNISCICMSNSLLKIQVRLTSLCDKHSVGLAGVCCWHLVIFNNHREIILWVLQNVLDLFKWNTVCLNSLHLFCNLFILKLTFWLFIFFVHNMQTQHWPKSTVA